MDHHRDAEAYYLEGTDGPEYQPRALRRIIAKDCRIEVQVTRPKVERLELECDVFIEGVEPEDSNRD